MNNIMFILNDWKGNFFFGVLGVGFSRVLGNYGVESLNVNFWFIGIFFFFEFLY